MPRVVNLGVVFVQGMCANVCVCVLTVRCANVCVLTVTGMCANVNCAGNVCEC